MLFKNKIEYTKGMFVEIYGTEIKKVRLVLRIITGIAVVAAIAFMIYGAAARGFIMPGDFFNLGISILMALLCTFLPNLMARSQMKKCKKKGLLGERTLRFTEHALEQSSKSRAIAYVGIKKPDGTLSWGAGVDPDIIRASIDALVTAINNR